MTRRTNNRNGTSNIWAALAICGVLTLIYIAAWPLMIEIVYGFLALLGSTKQ